MDTQTKAWLLKEGGNTLSQILKILASRPPGTTVTTKDTQEASISVARTGPPPPPVPSIREFQPTSTLALPSAEETAVELKRRLAKELYKAELDLVNGLKIAGRPCDCLSNKHTLLLEAAAEELISQEPGNPVYPQIIGWIKKNADKLTPEAIASEQYAAEYPQMANEFKVFRKRILGSAGEDSITIITPIKIKQVEQVAPAGELTLEEAKQMAAQEAMQAVEDAWTEV